MPKVDIGLTSFNAGELTPYMLGRKDFPKYRNGASKMENFISLIQGPMLKRSGTRYVATARDSSQNTVLIPFRFNTQQSYILEFSDRKMRVFRNGAQVVFAPAQTITAATNEHPVRITSAAHGYSPGDRIVISDVAGMTELNNREFIADSVATNTFTLQGVDGTGYGAYTSGGEASKIFEITTPYVAADLDGLSWAQSADVLYVCHRDYPVRKISRTGHTTWTITQVDGDWAPFLDLNTSTTTLYASSATGSVTITASASTFSASDVGRFVKIGILDIDSRYFPIQSNTSYNSGDFRSNAGGVYEAQNSGTTGNTPRFPVHRHVDFDESDGQITWRFKHLGFGYAQITGFTNDTTVTATVVKELPSVVVGSSNVTRDWAFGAWDDTSGYPRAVTFHANRLWFAGTKNHSQSMWGSKPGDFENFETTDEADSGIFLTLSTDEVNAIEWLRSRRRFLLGTAGGEFDVSSDDGEGLTGANAMAEINSSYGSAESINPVTIEHAVLFVQREKRKVRELVFDFDRDQLIAQDLTVLAEHLTEPRIRRMSFASEPFRLLWIVMEDGSLACMSYERTQDVVAMHKHILGGADVKVESVASIPRDDGLGDQTWMVVERTLDGATVKTIEFFETEWRSTNDLEDAFYVDLGLTYDNTAATSITGLWHLNGETVTILADGMVHPTKTITNGKLTLDYSASVVQIGLPYKARYTSIPLAEGNPRGIAAGRIQRVTDFAVRVYQLGPGLSFGRDFDNLRPVFLRDTDQVPTDPIPLFDGVIGDLTFEGDFDRNTTVSLQHDEPTPCSITAVLPTVQVNPE